MTSGARIPRHVQRQVREQAGELCEYCHTPQALSPITFHIDHVIPRSLGGATELGNLCLACGTCNAAKQARTRSGDPLTGRAPKAGGLTSASPKARLATLARPSFLCAAIRALDSARSSQAMSSGIGVPWLRMGMERPAKS